MLRRSDFIDATYAFSFVLANFGIAIAARMPMMTTTIRSSISVKPFLLVERIAVTLLLWWTAEAPRGECEYCPGHCKARTVPHRNHHVTLCIIITYTVTARPLAPPVPTRSAVPWQSAVKRRHGPVPE